jgi:muramoyltetrapeptide carboxypeptidase
MIPDKLVAGDEVRVVAPSRSLAVIGKETREIALKRFSELSLKLSFGKHVLESDGFMSSSVDSRIEDLHAAFCDRKVKAVLAVIGGYNSNQLLASLDYRLIKANPKILCGYSDITALNNAVYAKTGLVTYIGPHYSSFGEKLGFEYTQEYFKKAVMEQGPFRVIASDNWSSDEWYKTQDSRKFLKNPGHQVLKPGKAEGVLVGGNMGTLSLLKGTEFMPSLKNVILFLEDLGWQGAQEFPLEFDRYFQALLDQKGAQIKGIVFGRFQAQPTISIDMLKKIVLPKVGNIPVLAGLDFGHTTPMLTLPVGGLASLEAAGSNSSFTILEH